MPNSPLKIKTSFMFKKKKSLASEIKKKSKTSLDKSLTENQSIFVKKNKSLPKKVNKKNSLYKDTDSFSEDDNISEDETNDISIDEDDEKNSPPPSPNLFNLRNNSPPSDNEALIQRQNNIKQRDAFLASFMNDPEFAEAAQNVGLFENKTKPSSDFSTSPKRKPIKRKRIADEAFRTACRIPLEKRKSLRLQEKDPQFTYKDLPNEFSIASSFKQRKNYGSDEDVDNLEEVVYIPKAKRKRQSDRNTEKIPFLSVEDVTDAMIQNIAKKVSQKKYCTDYGTSCHQCRQKTVDTKTYCRSPNCEGVRGQFCGVCLLNRYGENVAEALKNPNWHCPVCRGICNCSFCRAREGKRPTGILTPLAFKSGHKSVKEFLESLRGKGDYADPTHDPKMLLGFSKDLEFAHMRSGEKEYIGTSNYFTKMGDIIETYKTKLLINVDDTIICCK